VHIKHPHADCHQIAVVVESEAVDLNLSVRYLEKDRANVCEDKPQKFCLPESSKIALVGIEDVVRKLTNPITVGGTKRVKSQVMFSTSLANYNLM